MEFYLEHHIFQVIISHWNGDLQNIPDMAIVDVFVYLINLGWDQNRSIPTKFTKVICCFRITTSTDVSDKFGFFLYYLQYNPRNIPKGHDYW